MTTFSINIKPFALCLVVLATGFMLSGCGTRPPSEERARQKSEKERSAFEKELSKIHPIGRDESRKLNKSEAYFACMQKSKIAEAEAEQIVRIKQSLEKKSTGGGFAVGAIVELGNSLERSGAKDKAREHAINACLIDNGYIRR